jgi:serine/threonine protein kinase
MEKRLVLPYESIGSLPEGANEVRLYHDPLLNVDRVGKRFDRSMVAATVLPEASTLQAIDHPNVVKIIHAAQVDGYTDPLMDVIEIITPYYPRGSITDALLRGETFASRSALAVVQAALRGLRELHNTHHVLHRDVKSGNILLDEPPTHAVVADIGVAGRMDSSGLVPAVNNPTIYSPPELYDGPLTVGADLYSLALVMRELLGGRFAYETITRDEVMGRLQDGRRALDDDVLELPVWSPNRLRRIYAKATALDPTRRYQSARDLAGDLAKVKIATWVSIADHEWAVHRDSQTGSRVHKVTAMPDPGGIRLSMTRETVTGARRVAGYPDETAPSLSHSAARQFFERVNGLVA